jgi:hypothetical protein
MSSLLDEIRQKFGASESAEVSAQNLSKLQSDAWAGNMCNLECIRPLCWRLFVGSLSTKGQINWGDELKAQRETYAAMKKAVIPKASEVAIDPLTAVIQKNDEWDRYYKVRYHL